MSKLYISTDIEADGPIPGINSMLSFASIAFSDDGKELGVFYRTLKPLEGAVQDKDTMENFWNKNPEAWAMTQKDQIEPKEAMGQYINWLMSLHVWGLGRPIFVGYPVCFDFMFVYWYLQYFGFGKPFSHSGIDIKTMAMYALRCDYDQAVKKKMPKSWFDPNVKHTHMPLDDAREQAYLFLSIDKILKERK